VPVPRRFGFVCIPDLAERIESATEKVYAIADGECVKVGKTRYHPQQRLEELQTGNPRVLRLLAWTVTLTERQAHRKLRRWHVRGEWFAASPELLRELSSWTWTNSTEVKQCR
jgi:hypothetical protein